MPERAPERFLVATEACGSGTPDLSLSSMFLGYVDLYRRKMSVGGASRGPGDRGRAQGGGLALLSPGCLDCFLTCTPCPLDHVCSKNHAPEGFIPFGLRLIFLFLRNTEIGKKTTICTGPWVSRLVPKIIQKCIYNPLKSKTDNIIAWKNQKL